MLCLISMCGSGDAFSLKLGFHLILIFIYVIIKNHIEKDSYSERSAVPILEDWFLLFSF